MNKKLPIEGSERVVQELHFKKAHFELKFL